MQEVKALLGNICAGWHEPLLLDNRIIPKLHLLNRGSYMCAHVLLNSLIKLRKSYKMRGLPSILLLFRNLLINSIIQEHEC